MKRIYRIVSVLFCLVLLCSCKGDKTPIEIKPAISGKTYYNTVDEYDNPEHSKIWFGSDGSFVMKDNFFEGWYEMNGSWSIKENVVTLDVEQSGYGKFSKVIFEIQDNETLILKTSLAGSKSDDIFSTTEVKGSGSDTGGNGNPSSAFTYSTYYNMFQTSANKSYVEIRSDNSFAIIDRNDFGIEEINGTYTQGSGILFLSSDDKREIEFSVYDEHTLILMSDNLGVSQYGDVFSDNNTIPESLNGPMGDNLGNKGSFWTHSAIQDINEAYLPTVEFNTAGEFIFTENCYAGMAQLRGWYEKKDSGFTCHVDDASQMQGFKGDDVKIIEFEYKDNKTLVLKTEICMSMPGDTFELKEQ